ncbi:MAG: pantetheine-phosphate adenylyltransferase [Chitinophagaceae bacterium]
MKRIAVFPGTFDPITLGHIDVVERSLYLFDEIIIGIGIHAGKQTMFPLEQRQAWIEAIFQQQPKVRVMPYSGLTVNFCSEQQALTIIRGIRTVGDFEYEKGIADMNRMIAPDIETYFLSCSPQYISFSSTLVRDLIRHKTDVSRFLHPAIQLP